jgi:FkbH-like protein
VECGWGAKSDALARIAADLSIGTDALAFVDDDPYERAEVGAARPEVLVLAPEEMAGAAGWPEFGAAAVTDEARRRGEMYAARRRRQAAERAFAGSREQFLASAGTRVTIAAASQDDVPRLHELSARTRQFNSAGQAAGAAEFAAWIAAPRTEVVTVRLRDAFGDDGIVGACVTSHGGDGTWTVRLLVMSCRAMGRGVIGGLLAWLVRSAASAGAREVAVPCVLNERNVPLRVALTGAGFRAGTGAGTDATAAAAVFRRGTGKALPELPAWLRAPGGPDEPIAAELRQMLARITGRDELASLPADAPLFGEGVSLDSLTGTLLLREVQRRFGVDVAGTDLNLDALATVSTLASFIAGQGG